MVCFRVARINAMGILWRALSNILSVIFLCCYSANLLAAQVTLAWDRSTDDKVDGYRLYYGQTSGRYTSNITVGNQTHYTVTDLNAGKTYYFAVTAYNDTVESSYSNEVSTTTALPAPVANFSATPTSGSAPLVVIFTDTSTGSVINRSWNFGDGSTGVGKTAVKSYTNPGTYTVSHTVSGLGGTNTRTHTDLISVTAAPVDTDNDGIPNNIDPDDDNDGMLDTWENTNNFNPRDSRDAAQDADGDGFTNRQEHDASTDPRNSMSYPRGGKVDKIAVVRPNNGKLRYFLDVDGDFNWTPQVDLSFNGFGFPSDKLIVGDWNGDGIDEIAVARRCGNGLCFYLDTDGSFNWTPGVDLSLGKFGLWTDRVIVGDWNGDGIDQIAVARQCGNELCYYIDTNANFSWTPGVDRSLGRFGFPSDTLIVGDWDGNGVDEIAVARPCGNQLCYFLDADGSFSWTPRVDLMFSTFGFPTDTVIVGDWNNDGIDQIAAARPCGNSLCYYLDTNGNFSWTPGVDQILGPFGWATDTVIVTGKW